MKFLYAHFLYSKYTVNRLDFCLLINTLPLLFIQVYEFLISILFYLMTDIFLN